MQYSYLNAGSDSGHQKYAIPFLKAAGRSNFYASNGQEVWRTGRTAGDISSDIYDDMSRMLGTLGRYEQWLSDTTSDILFAHSLGFDERNTGFFNDNFSFLFIYSCCNNFSLLIILSISSISFTISLFFFVMFCVFPLEFFSSNLFLSCSYLFLF